MQILMLLNGLGMIAAAAFTGLLMARGLFPLRGVIAAALFLFSTFFPFFQEYGLIRRGFKRLEGDLLGKLGQRFRSQPKVEIFDPGTSQPKIWRQRKDPIWLLLFITCFAGFLFMFDLIEHLPALLQDKLGQRPITNF